MDEEEEREKTVEERLAALDKEIERMEFITVCWLIILTIILLWVIF